MAGSLSGMCAKGAVGGTGNRYTGVNTGRQRDAKGADPDDVALNLSSDAARIGWALQFCCSVAWAGTGFERLNAGGTISTDPRGYADALLAQSCTICLASTGNGRLAIERYCTAALRRRVGLPNGFRPGRAPACDRPDHAELCSSRG